MTTNLPAVINRHDPAGESPPRQGAALEVDDGFRLGRIVMFNPEHEASEWIDVNDLCMTVVRP